MAVAERRGGAAEERIGELAGILLEHEEELAEQMDRAIFAAAPVLAGDPTIAAETSASNRANLRRWLTAVHAHPGAPVSGEPPPEAVEVAVSLIRRGMETGPLITAYRAGQNYAWGRWMELAAERIEQRGELIAVLERSSAQMNAYVDRVVDAVLAQAQLEREAMLGGAASRRAETIRMILEGAPLEPRAAASRLGWELDREQVAFVLWHAGGAPSGEAREQLEAAAVTLARAAAGGGRADRGGGRALTLPAGSSALWAWIAPASGAPDTDAMRAAMAELPASLRVAVGGGGGGRGGG
jgi:DNA-binding PucR family transcriptional regulator